MTNNEDDDDFGIEKGFELEPIVLTPIVVEDAPREAADSYDLEAARQNMHHLIQKGNVVLDDLISVARTSQAVGAFEQVSKMLKTLSDINKDLITVQEKKKHLKIADDTETDSPSEPKVINNNLFVGTTEEFSAMMETIEKKKNG